MSKQDNFIRMNDFLALWKQAHGEWIPNFKEGKIYSTKTDAYLKPEMNSRGYYVFCVHMGHGARRRVLLHRALWVMRYGIPHNPKLEVDHINNDRLDNRLCNLRLVTRGENQRNRPEKFARAEAIRAERAAGVKTRDLAQKYGYSQKMIQNIIAGTRYDPKKYPGTERKKQLHYSNPAAGEDMLRWKP